MDGYEESGTECMDGPARWAAGYRSVALRARIESVSELLSCIEVAWKVPERTRDMLS